jgi:hypothetical protein
MRSNSFIPYTLYLKPRAVRPLWKETTTFNAASDFGSAEATPVVCFSSLSLGLEHDGRHFNRCVFKTGSLLAATVFTL